MKSVPSKLLAALITALLVSATAGFFLPPIWSFDKIPTECGARTGIVSNKSESKAGFYTEYNLLLDSSNISVSPATYLVAEEGRPLTIYVCS